MPLVPGHRGSTQHHRIKASSERTSVGATSMRRAAPRTRSRLPARTRCGLADLHLPAPDVTAAAQLVLASVLTGEAKPVIKPRWVAEQQVRENRARVQGHACNDITTHRFDHRHLQGRRITPTTQHPSPASTPAARYTRTQHMPVYQFIIRRTGSHLGVLAPLRASSRRLCRGSGSTRLTSRPVNSHRRPAGPHSSAPGRPGARCKANRDRAALLLRGRPGMDRNNARPTQYAPVSTRRREHLTTSAERRTKNAW